MDNSEQINEQVNDHIISLKERSDEMGFGWTWDEIAESTNVEFREHGLSLTGNAARKRYKRNYSGMDDGFKSETWKDMYGKHYQIESEQNDGTGWHVVTIEPAMTRQKNQDGLEKLVNDTDVVAQLRDQFGISEEYSPKRIKTTASGDKTWYGAEWERQAVSEDKMELVLEQIKNHAPTYTEFTPLNPTGGHLLVPILYDAHVDKASLNGGKTYIHVVQEMIETALGLGLQIDRVLFVIGNDFGNFDNVQGNTTAGTSQDNNAHWARAIDTRCKYAVSAVEMFASVAPTDVIMVHGNHDRYSNQWLGKVLEAQFHNNQRVTVDNGHSPRKYYSWMQNCWGFVHGNEENPSMLPAIMATEYPEGYAFAKYREVFTGHFHRKQSAFYPLTEQNGLTIRWMPALSGTDDWHNLKGYVGARRAGLGIIYNENGYKLEYSIDA